MVEVSVSCDHDFVFKSGKDTEDGSLVEFQCFCGEFHTLEIFGYYLHRIDMCQPGDKANPAGLADGSEE